MSALEWLAVALIALALAFPAGVAFGIAIGQHRERDKQAAVGNTITIAGKTYREEG